ncbi:MAG: hypothetical protein F4X69_15880 [Gemmatimonadetes bacterium]|nr:hypothetical protein [Gemmatimonadota bacterium]
MRSWLTAVFIASLIIGSTTSTYAQEQKQSWFGAMSGFIGTGPTKGGWGLSVPFIYRHHSWGAKGLYFGVSGIRHKDADAGSSGGLDNTWLIPIGVSFISNHGITTSLHLSTGYAFDYYDTWGLGGYKCREAINVGVGREVGCRAKRTFAYGYGADVSIRALLLGATWVSEIGWYLQVGMRFPMK